MKDFKIYFWGATVLLVIYLVAQYNRPSPINWNPTFYYNDKIPFGTYITYRQLPDIFPGAKVSNTNLNLYDLFHDKDFNNSDYFIIANTINLSKLDYLELVKYIRAGNSAFISTFYWRGFLADTLNIGTGVEYKATGLNFTNAKLKQSHDYHFDKEMGSEYFSSFDTAHAVVLGKNEQGKSTLLSFKFGKGNLYLCANPQVFTNFSLLNSQDAEYAAKALSYMPAKPQIYWDEFQNGDIEENMSPMRVFLSHPNLQWAYYISLCSLVIFIFYEMKRRQRIIAIIEPLKNSTVDFVNVVGQVYYEQRNNQNIAEKKILYFLEHLRTQYYLKTSPLDREFTERLAQKTGIELPFARNLVGHLAYVAAQRNVSDQELILLNQLIEQFYIQSK
jgi:hypothetical protein